MDKNELIIKMEAVVNAFEDYCETLGTEKYKMFYDVVNHVLAMCDNKNN